MKLNDAQLDIVKGIASNLELIIVDIETLPAGRDTNSMKEAASRALAWARAIIQRGEIETSTG